MRIIFVQSNDPHGQEKFYAKFLIGGMKMVTTTPELSPLLSTTGLPTSPDMNMDMQLGYS